LVIFRFVAISVTRCGRPLFARNSSSFTVTTTLCTVEELDFSRLVVAMLRYSSFCGVGGEPVNSTAFDQEYRMA
jgi:hypothetical protein